MEESKDLEVCDICSEVTSSLKEHLEKEHIKQEEEEEIGYLTQEYCQKSVEKKQFNTRSKVRTRISEHIFPCEKCGKIFSSDGFLKKHLQIHGKTKPFKCDSCGHNYATKTGLKRHSCSVQSNRKEGLPSGERLYECEICAKKFTQGSGLYSHMNSHMLSDLRRYECDICNRRFARNYHLNDHKQAVHEKLKPYHCQKCDKKFFRKFTAQHHSCHGEARGWFDKQERTVTFKGPMNELNQVKVPVHSCPECGRTFNQKRTLAVHVKSHQLRPYKCHLCRNSYIEMSALMEHRKKAHELKLQAVLPLSISTEPKIPCSNKKAVTVHVKQSIARCEFCEKIFLRKASLESHKCPVNKQNFIVVKVEVSDS